jgi:hypothetical protein
VKIALKKHGKVGRVDPNDKVDDPVHFDRDGAGPHELLTLEKVGEDFFAEWEAAQRALSLTKDGQWVTRKKGTRQGWETFKATIQPEGKNFLYRREGDRLVDVVEFVEVK